MSDLSAHTASLFSQIQVNHGPAGLLGRFFLQVEEFARGHGISLSLGTMQDLLDTNTQNRDTWLPLFSLFDPRFNKLDASNSFCIIGKDRKGTIVATQAARIFHWYNTNYFEEAESLRLLYDDPELSKLPDESCKVHALAAKGISGDVAFTGAAWYQPDYRGIGLTDTLPRLSRAYAHALWNPDCSVTMMSEYNVGRGVFPRNGQKNIEWDIELQKSRMGSVRFSLQWTKREEGLKDLSEFLSSFDVEAKILRRTSSAE